MKKQIKKTNRVAKKHESGRSMIEMVGVLAVMGLITAAAFVLITSALSSQKLSRIDDDVSTLVQGVRLLYNPSDNFAGLTDDALGVLGFRDAKNPYGGDYKLATSDVATVCDSTTGICTVTTTAAEAKFTIEIDGLGQKICKTLAGRVWPGGGVVDTTNSTCGDASGNSVIIEYGKADRTANQ